MSRAAPSRRCVAGRALAAGRRPAVAPRRTRAASERVTFEEAVRRATRAQPDGGPGGAGDPARPGAARPGAGPCSVPSLYGDVGTTILDAARGFDGNITQPRTQSAFSATAVLPAPRRRALGGGRTRPPTRSAIARISAEETRRQVALTAAESYLAVIAAERQREIAVRNRDTARALAEYARARLEAGQGSRLNHVRVVPGAGRRRRAGPGRRAGRAAGPGGARRRHLRRRPGGCGRRPRASQLAAPPAGDDAWLIQRPDVRLLTAQVQAADRVVRDTWKSWLPTATAAFTPAVRHAGRLLRAREDLARVLPAPGPDLRRHPGRRPSASASPTGRRPGCASTRVKVAGALRGPVRPGGGRRATSRSWPRAAGGRERRAKRSASPRSPTRPGATTNIEVVQAQQTARNAEVAAALAEDRLRQARLDLLVALGQFPE